MVCLQSLTMENTWLWEDFLNLLPAGEFLFWDNLDVSKNKTPFHPDIGIFILQKLGHFTFKRKISLKKSTLFLLTCFILVQQLKFGISKRRLLEQPTHLDITNIIILSCSLLILTFAFKNPTIFSINDSGYYVNFILW